jgi:hypothetical protein
MEALSRQLLPPGNAGRDREMADKRRGHAAEETTQQALAVHCAFAP